MVWIAPETEALTPLVEDLYDACFAPGRGALSSYRLRDGVEAADGLSLAALDDYGAGPEVVGAIRHWPIWIAAPQTAPEDAPEDAPLQAPDGGRAHAGEAALLLGPLAVHPTRQGEGLGGLLIAEGLERAEAHGWRLVVLIGDAPFYKRFGFRLAQDLSFPPPTNPERILAKRLDGAAEPVAGRVVSWRARG